MTNKLLLAEGLDVIRHGEVLEYELNKRLVHVKSKKGINEIGRLVQDYEVVYRTYVKGLEILNVVRHLTDSKSSASAPGSADSDRQLNEFCRQRMRLYMDRCSTILDKVSAIFIPIDQVAIPMEEYTAGSSIPTGLENIVLKDKNTSVEHTVELSRGTYVVTVLNKDNYTILAPAVRVSLTTKPLDLSVALLETLNVHSEPIPGGMGWRRVIGTTRGAQLCIVVHSDGSRDAHLSLHISAFHSDCPNPTKSTKVEEETTTKQQAAALSLEKTSSSTLTQASPAGTLLGSVQPLTVRPKGMTCEERYDLFMLATATWQSYTVKSACLPGACEQFLQKIDALPMPSEIH